MTPIYFEVKGKKEVNRLGFRYEPDENQCRVHIFNNVPVKIDLRDHPEFSLKDIEDSLDVCFKKVLRQEMKDEKIERIHKVTWYRVFFIGETWNPREFTARFWVRITSVDKPEAESADSHVIRA